MNPTLRKYLGSIGLSADASDADAERFFASLTGDHREIANGLADPAAFTDEDGDGKCDSCGNAEDGCTCGSDAKGADGEGEEEDKAQGNTAAVEIIGLAKRHGLGLDWAQAQIQAGASVQDAKDAVLAKLAKSKAPVRISVGADRNLSSMVQAIPDAIQVRAGAKHLVEFDANGNPRLDANGKTIRRQPHERAREFQRPLVEIARQYLQLIGVTGAAMMGANQVVSLALNPHKLQSEFGISPVAAAGYMPGDFPSLLGTTVNRSLRQAYMETQSTWELWARRATAPDFRQIQRLSLSEAPSLQTIPSGGGYNYVALGETKEVYALADYGHIIPLGRRAIINDDLDAFSRIPMLQGAAAKRLEDDVAYAPITTGTDGQTMTETSRALFNTTDKTKASANAALAVASLAIGVAAMANQKGPKGEAVLNLTPKFLLVPRAIEAVAAQLIGSVVDPSKSNAAINPFANKLTIVSDARLDTDSTTAWYLVADPNQIDTIEVCFLADEPMPVLEQETDFDTDGVKFKVRHTVAARAIDFRGFFKNAGA